MQGVVYSVVQWFRDAWGLPWKLKAPFLALSVGVTALIATASILIATGWNDNTAVSGVFQAPTPTATSGVTPTPAQTPTPTPHPTSTVERSPTPSPAATTSVAQEEEPPGVANPPATSAETPTLPAAPAPTPTPKPIPTPTAIPHPSYWVFCGGQCWFLAPEIECLYSRYEMVCASPQLVLYGPCSPLPYRCAPESGWLVWCDTIARGVENCNHSLDGAFSCWGSSLTGNTDCIGLANHCTALVDSVTTCSRYDLDTYVTCRWGFSCDSPTAGSFTCTRHDPTFSCP